LSAAINRFQKVLDEYESSNQVPEALYRLIASFSMMNLKEEASRSLRVAQYNFPDSPWTKKAEKLMSLTNSEK